MKPEHELAYRVRAWKYSMPTRRAGIVFMAIAALIHVVVVVAGFVKHKDTEGRIGDQAPSIACTVAGLGLLALGWKRHPQFAAWWDYIGSVAITLLASPMIAMYVACRRRSAWLAVSCRPAHRAFPLAWSPQLPAGAVLRQP